MLKSKFSVLAKMLFAAFLVSLFVFVGCTPDANPDEPAPSKPASDSDIEALVGTWAASESEVYIIKKTSFESVGTYSGNNLVVEKTSDTAGTIFIKYVDVYDWDNVVYEDPNDSSYLHYTYEYAGVSYEMWVPINQELVGKWYAVSYQNLTSTSIELAGAYKAGGVSATDTLEDAKEEFTSENGYFGRYSECVKTKK